MKSLSLISLLTFLIGISICAQVETPVSSLDVSLPCVNKNFNIRTIVTIDSLTREPLISESELNDVYAKVNYYFSPICMSMTSCDHKIVDNYAYNRVISKKRAQETGVVFAYPQRLNIVFVKYVFDDLCGYSLIDGIQTSDKAIIFVELSCADQPAEQIAYHMGRLMGLHDTNYDSINELADESNCDTAGDRICDTPTDPLGMELNLSLWDEEELADTLKYAMGCEFVWKQRKSNGEYFQPDTRQYKAMAANYLASTFKQF